MITKVNYCCSTFINSHICNVINEFIFVFVKCEKSIDSITERNLNEMYFLNKILITFNNIFDLFSG